MSRTDNKAIKKLAFVGVMASFAIVLGYLEFILHLNPGIYGAKIGLSNLAVVVTLYLADNKSALFVLAVKVIVTSLLFGSILSFFYSLAGGIISFTAMTLLKRFSPLGVTGVSIAGGTAHNIGQLAVAVVAFDNLKIAFYLPVLLIVGALTGLLIGLLATFTVNRLGKLSPFGSE
ncbi:MAG: Gx transporter family protein [Eubacteriales bacterium]